MPVDAVFCDQSRQEFNEFVPVDLILGPYLQDLQSSAATVDTVCRSEGSTLKPPTERHSFVEAVLDCVFDRCPSWK